MKNIRLVIALAALSSLPAYAQTDEILHSIEQNNTTLRALGEQAEADKLGNRTGISLTAPEVEFGRLWGRPAAIGNRTDIAVSQSFDIATATGARLRQAKRQNELIDLKQASQRIAVLLEAEEYCIELIHYNRLARELETRLEHARTIAGAYSRMLESGASDRLEYNKAMLNLTTAQNDAAQNETERTAILMELQRLNGGIAIALEDIEYPLVSLPADLEQWCADAATNNPEMEYARREAEVLKRGVGLARMERMPEFSVGYMREKTFGQSYQGVTVGMSIPLWGNRNSVRQAQAALNASTAREEDSRVQFDAQIQILHERATALGKTAEDYRRVLYGSNNETLLKKALDAGEISLLDYIVEMGLYYDAMNRAMETERDYHIACARLAAYHSIGAPPREAR